MRAVVLKEFGPPENLVVDEVPDPVPGSSQVLVDVAFANITFVETQFRAKRWGPFTGELPMIMGNGVGGVVAAVGAPAAAGLLGRHVVTGTGGMGGYAERVAVAADGLIDVPVGLELDAAVALLADGRTAMLLVDAVRPGPGERVLVEAAGGGVGTLLVQLAAAAGATVVAAAGSAEKLAIARELGATSTVDYRRPDWSSRVDHLVDVVFDGVGGAIGAAAFELLRPGGRMVSFGFASGSPTGITPDAAAERGRTVLGLPRPSAAEARRFSAAALEAAATGRLRPVIGQRFPLAEAARAHAAIEARTTIGKTLLYVPR